MQKSAGGQVQVPMLPVMGSTMPVLLPEHTGAARNT